MEQALTIERNIYASQAHLISVQRSDGVFLLKTECDYPE